MSDTATTATFRAALRTTRDDTAIADASSNVVERRPCQRTVQLLGCDAQHPRAISQYHALAAEFHDAVICAIPRLLRRRSPSAVPRRVVPVHVDPVQRAPGRTRPHIAKEGREVVSPLRRYSNATPPVSLEPLAVGILAPVNSSTPRTVLAQAPTRSPTPRRCAVLGAASARRLAPQTSTATRSPCAQRVSKNDSRLSAIALARPRRVTARRINQPEYDESVKSLPCQIDQTHERLLLDDAQSYRTLSHPATVRRSGA